MSMFICILLLSAVFAEEEFKGDSVIRIIPETDGHIQILKDWLSKGLVEIDIWRDVSHPGENVDVHIKASDVTNVKEMLTKNSIEFSLMIEDLQQVVNEEQISNQKNAYSSGFDYNRYNNYDDIKAELMSLSRRYSNAVSLFNVGKSYEGQDMVGIKVSDCNSVSGKPVIWIDGGIHAREWISPATVMYFIKYLLESRTSDVAAALSKYDFYLLPVFNVDGYRYTQNGGRARLWRKTRKPYRGGWRTCYGADPNRNWGYKWGGEGTSDNPCDDIYHGTGPFSEVCTRNVAQYLKTISNLKSYWNIHAYSQLLLTPWSYTTNRPRNFAEMMRVANVFTSKISQRYGTQYRAGPPSKYLYNAAGGSMDWTYATLGVVYSYAPELRDTGRYGFVLPPSYIAPTGLETSEALIATVLAMK